MDMHETIEELLESEFPIRYVPSLYSEQEDIVEIRYRQRRMKTESLACTAVRNTVHELVRAL
jgi:hypothetical protein